MANRQAYLDRIRRKKKTVTKKKEVQEEKPKLFHKPKTIYATLTSLIPGVSFGQIAEKLEGNEDGDPGSSA